MKNNSEGTSNPLRDKSRFFALRIVRLYKYLAEVQKEFVISKQLLRSGTSIGANLAEAQYAQSKKDFVSKLSIALKETAETEYWVDLIHMSEYISDKEFKSVFNDAEEIRKMLIISINTAKNSLLQDKEKEDRKKKDIKEDSNDE